MNGRSDVESSIEFSWVGRNKFGPLFLACCAVAVVMEPDEAAHIDFRDSFEEDAQSMLSSDFR